ncbi:MAG: hypothetical protein ACRED3_18630, partial [Bradyrhizobium sp.]
MRAVILYAEPGRLALHECLADGLSLLSDVATPQIGVVSYASIRGNRDRLVLSALGQNHEVLAVESDDGGRSFRPLPATPDTDDDIPRGSNRWRWPDKI